MVVEGWVLDPIVMMGDLITMMILYSTVLVVVVVVMIFETVYWLMVIVVDNERSYNDRDLPLP